MDERQDLDEESWRGLTLCTSMVDVPSFEVEDGACIGDRGTKGELERGCEGEVTSMGRGRKTRFSD